MLNDLIYLAVTSSQEFRGDNKPEWAPLVVTPQSRLPLL